MSSSSTTSSAYSAEMHERIDDYLNETLDLSSFESLLERSIWASVDDLKRTVRNGFRLFSPTATDADIAHDQNNYDLGKKDVLALQRFAIESLRLMEDQKDLWERTSVSVDEGRGLRVIATSG
jgi:hypothetical protein